MANPVVSELRPEGAFVVEFRLDAGLTGRVEHIVSGRAARFESEGELLAFVRTVLGPSTEPMEQEDTES
jgi:hypothetical protein